MIVAFAERDIDGLSEAFGLVLLLVDVNDAGVVEREIGIDKFGRVTHAFPGTGKYGRYGILDMNRVVPSQNSEFPEEEFECLWRKLR